MYTQLVLLVAALSGLDPAHGLAMVFSESGDSLVTMLLVTAMALFAVAAGGGVLLTILSAGALQPDMSTSRSPRLADSALRDQVEDVIALQDVPEDTD